ncbi:hypothetical protein MML48_4g00013168 [Holotrichia oblita]|uniref:Uncharacterized protein n=1 Tax=Holotrichia oblita TaxID=644536 RepID=A0ACB9T6Z5_HOLOL|nr:hypothetical protein MML48_4g00013168 [Holotrichia oblita]
MEGGGMEPDLSQVLHSSNLNRAFAKPDILNTEFMYFSAVLKVVAPAVSTDDNRQKVVPWIHKLFRPEYHSTPFREKRNKYLLYLTLTLLNDEVFGIFNLPPPDGALPELNQINMAHVTAADWELDATWQETLQNLPQDFKHLECSVHESPEECDDDHLLDTILDQEFQFLLYLAKPYAAMLKGRYDSTKVATWMQTLCTIHGNSCSSMKGIRNDYMMALLGYVHDLRLIGPFAEYPPWRTLPPLAEAAKMAADNRPITDPTGPDATAFLSSMPKPSDGAFCYIAITGDLVKSSFGPAP